MRRWKNFVLSLLCTFGAYFLLFHEFTTWAKPMVAEESMENSLFDKPAKKTPQKDSLELNNDR